MSQAASDVVSSSKAPAECELTILMPCLNEEETVGICIEKALTFLEENQVNGEVLVADNGSTDRSVRIARSLGARVVEISERGYGSALIGGSIAARGKYVIMGDADDSYDFTNLMPFLESLRTGTQLVMGNRFKGGIAKGAMPALHQYLGNPVLSWVGRIFYGSKIGDFHCGLRGYDRLAVLSLHLHTTGMEYASEMIVQATLHHLTIEEVPTTLSPDGRSHPPHLRSWSDGWRHLRFLLMYSPKWLFLYPGLFLIGVGFVLGVILGIAPIQIANINFDINTLLYAAGSVFIGFQAVLFAVFSNIYAYHSAYIPVPDHLIRTLSRFTIERGLIVGLLSTILGIALSVFALVYWSDTSFGDLNPARVMRITIPAVVLIVCGIELCFSSFMIGILGIRKRDLSVVDSIKQPTPDDGSA